MKSSDDYVPTDPKPLLKPDALYMGDGGRIFCGKHAGTSALYTGRDISGQRVERVNVEQWKREGVVPQCETCRFGR